MMEDIITGIPLGIILSFMIGPVFFLLLETSITKGFRAALIFDFGVLVADIVFISIAYFSSYRLIQGVGDEPALFIFGGLIMITYGLISIIKLNNTKKTVKERVKVELIKKNYWTLFVKGFFLNFINVGVLGFWLIILITIGPRLDLEIPRLILFFTSVLGSYLFIDIMKIILAKKLKHKLNVSNIVKIKKITSILLILFGISIMSQAWFPNDQKIVKSALEKIGTKNK